MGARPGLLSRHRGRGVDVRAVRTRAPEARRFVGLHEPGRGEWMLHRGHELDEGLERETRRAQPRTTVLTPPESVDDPASPEEIPLDPR